MPLPTLVRPTCLSLPLLPDPQWCRWLEQAGYQTHADSAARPDLILLFPDAGAGDLALGLQRNDQVPVVMVTRGGALIHHDAGGGRHVLALTEAASVVDWLRSFALPPRPTLVGSSPVTAQLRRRIERVSASEASVLINGESGTGKELVAGQIHRLSGRRQGPFICVNCASIPDTLVESELFGHQKGAFTGASASRDGAFLAARGGTLFLDEIGDMSLFAQAKLLRALEQRAVTRLGSCQEVAVDIRVVAASNRDLPAMVRQGTFREDLYYRLAVLEITVPPLRERAGEVPELIEHFCRLLHRAPAVSPEALELLQSYAWPGNVRELKNVITASVVECEGQMVQVEHLPGRLRESSAQRAGEERRRIVAALTEGKGNKSKAARALCWSRVTLYRKLVRHGLTEAAPASASMPDNPPAIAAQAR